VSIAPLIAGHSPLTCSRRALRLSSGSRFSVESPRRGFGGRPDTSARRFAGETTNTIHMYQTSVPVYGRPTYHPGPGLKTYLSVDGQHWIEVPHPPRTYTRELAQALGEAGPGSSLIQGAKVVNLPVDPIAPTDTEIVRLIAEPAAARRR
jgi:hypothetical protein